MTRWRPKPSSATRSRSLRATGGRKGSVSHEVLPSLAYVREGEYDPTSSIHSPDDEGDAEMVSVYAPRRRAMRPFGYKPAALGVAAMLALAAACGNTNDLQVDEPSTVNAASKATKLAAIDASLSSTAGSRSGKRLGRR